MAATDLLPPSQHAERQAPALTIAVAGAFASGPTELAAFDAALMQAGVHHFNLIALSSVIPPASEIRELEGPASPPGEWGDRLYVVLAQQREAHAGLDAWAGIGWVQDASGKGLFVEHEGGSRTEVADDIRSSLDALVRTRGGGFGPVHMRLAGGTCGGEPVCALVVAAFQSSAWE